jgi:hypothetical protein
VAPPRRFRTTIIANPETAKRSWSGWSTPAQRASRSAHSACSTTARVLAVPPRAAVSAARRLYGFDPDPADDFRIQLGEIAPRGEVGALIVSLDTLLRMSSNPFFPCLLERIEEGLARHSDGKGATIGDGH